MKAELSLFKKSKNNSIMKSYLKSIITIFFLVLNLFVFAGTGDGTTTASTTNVIATQTTTALATPSQPGTGGGGEGPGAKLPIDDYQYAILAAGMLLAGYFSVKSKEQKA